MPWPAMTLAKSQHHAPDPAPVSVELAVLTEQLDAKLRPFIREEEEQRAREQMEQELTRRVEEVEKQAKERFAERFAEHRRDTESDLEHQLERKVAAARVEIREEFSDRLEQAKADAATCRQRCEQVEQAYFDLLDALLPLDRKGVWGGMRPSAR